MESITEIRHRLHMLIENNDIAGVKKYVKDGNHLEDIHGTDRTPLLRAMRLYHFR